MRGSMKKLTAIGMVLLLSGCINSQGYEPALSEPPADMAKYKADAKACRDDATPDMAELLNSVGTVSGTQTTQASSGNVIAHTPKNFFASVDECLKKKGYKVEPLHAKEEC